MSTFLRRTGRHTTVGFVFTIFIIGCLIVLAVEPFEWLDAQRRIAPLFF